jgi:pimeloyl-ACP methyl ester carboxylesterase
VSKAAASAGADRSRLVRLRFGRLYVRDLGPYEDVASPGVPRLLLHDFGLCSYTWSEVERALASTHRVIAPDLPGAGNSDRPDPDSVSEYSLEWMRSVLANLLEELDLERVDVVAHGLGAALVVGLAPERVRRLVLIAPVCFPVEVAFGTILRVPVVGPLLFRGLLRKAEFRAFVESQYSTPELLPKARFDVYWDRISRDGGVEAAYAMSQRLADPGELSDLYRRVKAPTRFVWGDRDRILPVEDAERSVALVDGARLSVIDGCGHAPQEERPAELLRIVEEHLGATDPK